MTTIESRGQEPLQEEQLRKINALVSQAEDAFAESRELDPHGEHSYIAHVQLLVRTVQFGFRLSGKSHYAEFLASPLHLSYQNMVEKAESLLAEVKRLLYFGRQPRAMFIILEPLLLSEKADNHNEKTTRGHPSL